jgi:leader peptidase (prepilin peptidase) / N-methyltransferase
MPEVALLAAGFAVLGAAVGLGADFISRGWPVHPEGPPRRGFDWRTIVLVVSGAAVYAGLAFHWYDRPRDLMILGASCVALLVLLATDLDQKLLPDLLTLPLIGGAAVLLVIGWSPLLADKPLGLASGILAAVGAPVFLFITDRLLGGQLGDGDLKLAVGIGLLTGVSLLVAGLLVASVGFSVVLIALMVARRIGLKSAVPFGPVLIFGTFVALLIG